MTLVYFWLNSVDLAIERVRTRVISGGHDIPDETIRRRYITGLENLSKIYLPICDYWMIFDNSEHPSGLIAEGFRDKDTEVYRQDIYTQIIKQ